jgi:hypothetical protein
MTRDDRKALENWAANLGNVSDASLSTTAADTLASLRALVAETATRDEDRQFLFAMLDPVIAELRKRAAAQEKKSSADLADLEPRGRA